jgi:hypothetical protein
MGVEIDTEEFIDRLNKGKGTFQNEGDRKSIVVRLRKTYSFSTLGALRSDVLPLFLYTQKGSSKRTTVSRLTIQAIPAGSPCQSSSLFELAAIRGLPDSSQLTSILFPLIVLDILLKACRSSSLFFQIFSTPNPRTLQNGKRSYCEEMLVRVYTYDKDKIDLVLELLSLSDADTTPRPYRVKSWKGLISKQLAGFRYSPTNVPDLCSPQDVLLIPRMSGIEEDDYQLIQSYFTLDVTSTEDEFPSAMGYYRGNIERPDFKEASIALIILSPSKGGEVPFALDRWNKDYPTQSSADLPADYVRMPGTEQLLVHFAINPVPWSKPKEVSKPSFGKGIDITPIQAGLPTSGVPRAEGKPSKRKRQGNQTHITVSSSSVPPNTVPKNSQSLVIVAPKKSLNFSSSSTTSTLVTKQAGDALVSQDSLKLDKVIAGLDRVESRAEEDRANNNRLFSLLFDRLEKMGEKKQE